MELAPTKKADIEKKLEKKYKQEDKEILAEASEKCARESHSPFSSKEMLMTPKDDFPVRVLERIMDKFIQRFHTWKQAQFTFAMNLVFDVREKWFKVPNRFLTCVFIFRSVEGQHRLLFLERLQKGCPFIFQEIFAFWHAAFYKPAKEWKRENVYQLDDVREFLTLIGQQDTTESFFSRTMQKEHGRLVDYRCIKLNIKYFFADWEKLNLSTK